MSIFNLWIKKQFTQELALKILPILVETNGSAYPDADDENRWATFISRFVDKIYKKGELNDSTK